MNIPGLVSITFRNLSVEEVIETCLKNNLKAIEWGADVHLIPGDIKQAEYVKELMDKNNLVTSSYGSYYRVGLDNEYSFEDIIKTAAILKAKDIRVWAGRLGSKDADEDYFNNVVADSKRIADLAFKANLRVSYEYHSKTLTDTPESALRLLEAVNNDNMKLFWQPAVDVEPEQRVKDIIKVKDYLTSVHTFAWQGIEREDLANQISEWTAYINTLNEIATNEDRYFLLEFVKDDSLDQLAKDAKTLNELLYDII